MLWARHVQAASLQWLKSSTWSISLIIAVLYHIITIASLKINDINKMHKLADMVSSSITVHNRSINDWLGDIMQYWWCDWICADYRAWHFHNCQMRCWGGFHLVHSPCNHLLQGKLQNNDHKYHWGAQSSHFISCTFWTSFLLKRKCLQCATGMSGYNDCGSR